MQIPKDHVDTVVGVTDRKTTSVRIRLSDDVVIALYRETMKGYCPVCGFSKLSEGRRICDTCLETEETTLLYFSWSQPYGVAMSRILHHLMPSPPVLAVIPHHVGYAIEQLGEYARLMEGLRKSPQLAMSRLAKLAAWAVARMTKLAEQDGVSC